MTNFALLHGGGQGGWVWDEVAGLLSENGAKVIALDVPGCGEKRGRETSDLSVPEIVDELIADLRTSGLNDLILVGHSQAGTIMPKIVAKVPDLLHRLVYLCCSAPLPGQNIMMMMGQGLHGENADEVGWARDRKAVGKQDLYSVMFCNDMDEVQTTAFMNRASRDDWPMAANLATDWSYDHLIDVPSSYILCEQDNALPFDWQHRFAERLHCERIVNLDAGHQAMTTQPEAVAKLLLAEAAIR
jgi:pimeloyl-ACP methyl ester carboxylesterase